MRKFTRKFRKSNIRNYYRATFFCKQNNKTVKIIQIITK